MYLFETVEKQEQLYKELQEWLETPYRHWSGVKGLGCDCVHFLVRVLECFGYGPIKVPHYAPDWHFHNDAQLLLDGLRQNVDSDEWEVVPEDPGTHNFRNGDIILFKWGKTLSHGAWWFNGYLYHAVAGARIIRSNAKEKMWMKRMRIAFRVKQPCH
jgi:cell wall-associated NlpC family hydrolase